MEIATSAAGQVGPLLFIDQAEELTEVLHPDSTVHFEVQHAVSTSGYIDKAIFEEYVRRFVSWINGTLPIGSLHTLIAYLPLFLWYRRS